MIKFKSDELAKMKKVPRVIGDYGVKASLFGAPYLPMLKSIMEQWIIIDDLHMKFVATPDKNEMEQVFTYLFDDNVKYCVIFFSDDAVLKVPTTSGAMYMNLDISTCDISNTQFTFNMLLSSVSGHPTLHNIIRGCIQQCMRGCRIRRKSGINVFLKTSRAIEYSGTVLTTALNDWAMYAIGCTIYHLHRGQLYDREQTKKEITKYAMCAGYNITLEACECIEDIQFLKFSPTYVNGKVVTFLNLGVVFRAVGRLKVSSLPKKRSVLQDHLNGVLVGLNGVQHSPFTAWANSDKPIVEKYHLQGLKQRGEVPLSSYCRRYRISAAELLELIGEFQSVRVGKFVAHEGFSTILRKDYGG